MVAPETELEKKIFDIASTLLKHNQFGVTSNLISMGLTSLTAMRLSAAIQQQLGLVIPTKDILRTPVIRSLTQLADNGSQAPVITVHEKRDYYPITENQRVVYHMEKFSGMELATLSPRPENPVGMMARESSYVNINQVDTWCKEQGIAVNLLFQAAFSYALSMILREDKVAYTTLNHGRMDKRLREAYGMFVRTVPVMSEIKEGQTVREYIQSFRGELMSSIRYGAYPFTKVTS